MKKLICLCIIAIMSVGCLTACHKHVYTEATCTTLATCTECGKTTGELGEHDYVDATYQSGPKCIYCGEVNGEKIQAYFDEKGLDMYTLNLSDYNGSSFKYTTSLYNNINASRTLSVEPIWARVLKDKSTDIKSFYTPDNQDFVYYETDVNKFQDVDGYEWRAVSSPIVLSNQDYDKVYYGGLRWYITPVDYYTGEFLAKDPDVVDGENRAKFSVNYNGETYSDCFYISWTKLINKGPYQSYIETYNFVRVPVGYDGITIAYINTTSHDDAFYLSDLPIEKIGIEGMTFLRLN